MLEHIIQKKLCENLFITIYIFCIFLKNITYIGRVINVFILNLKKKEREKGNKNKTVKVKKLRKL